MTYLALKLNVSFIWYQPTVQALIFIFLLVGYTIKLRSLIATKIRHFYITAKSRHKNLQIKSRADCKSTQPKSKSSHSVLMS